MVELAASVLLGHRSSGLIAFDPKLAPTTFTVTYAEIRDVLRDFGQRKIDTALRFERGHASKVSVTPPSASGHSKPGAATVPKAMGAATSGSVTHGYVIVPSKGRTRCADRNEVFASDVMLWPEFERKRHVRGTQRSNLMKEKGVRQVFKLNGKRPVGIRRADALDVFDIE